MGWAIFRVAGSDNRRLLTRPIVYLRRGLAGPRLAPGKEEKNTDTNTDKNTDTNTKTNTDTNTNTDTTHAADSGFTLWPRLALG